MTRRYGRATMGKRLGSGILLGHRKTSTLVVRLSNPGIAASFMLDSPIDRNAFEAYISSVLVAEMDQDDIVVMNNLSSRKGRQCAKGSKQRAL